GTQSREEQVMERLLGRIVEEQRTHHVTGEGCDAVTLEPGAFAGTRQPDRENHNALGCALRFGARRLSHRRGCEGRISGSRGQRDRLLASAPSAAPTSATAPTRATGVVGGLIARFGR